MREPFKTIEKNIELEIEESFNVCSESLKAVIRNDLRKTEEVPDTDLLGHLNEDEWNGFLLGYLVAKER